MPVLSAVEGPVLSAVEGPVLSAVEGPVLSAVEGPVLSPVEGRFPYGHPVLGTGRDEKCRISPQVETDVACGSGD
jgi:hypothetical protein